MTNDDTLDEILRRSLARDMQKLLLPPQFMQDERASDLKEADLEKLRARIFAALDGNPEDEDKRLDGMCQSYRRLFKETTPPEDAKDLTDKMHHLANTYIISYCMAVQSRSKAANTTAGRAQNTYEVRDEDTLSGIAAEWLRINSDCPDIDGRPLPLMHERRLERVEEWIRTKNRLKERAEEWLRTHKRLKDANGVVGDTNVTLTLAGVLAGQPLELPAGERIDKAPFDSNQREFLQAMLKAYGCIETLQPYSNRGGSVFDAELVSHTRTTLLETMEFVRLLLVGALRQQGKAAPVEPPPTPTPPPSNRAVFTVGQEPSKGPFSKDTAFRR